MVCSMVFLLTALIFLIIEITVNAVKPEQRPVTTYTPVNTRAMIDDNTPNN